MLDDLAYRAAVLLLILLGAGWSSRIRRSADASGGKICREADGALVANALRITGFLFYGSLCAWLLYPPAVRWAELPVTGFARWLGLPLAAGGVGLGLWSLHHLGRNVTPTAVPRPDASLVTSGPYRRVRHPLYSSMLLTIPGLALMSANLLVLGGGIATFCVLMYRLRREEEALDSKFGPAYDAYRRKAGAILPRFRAERSARHSAVGVGAGGSRRRRRCED